MIDIPTPQDKVNEEEQRQVGRREAATRVVDALASSLIAAKGLPPYIFSLECPVGVHPKDVTKVFNENTPWQVTWSRSRHPNAPVEYTFTPKKVPSTMSVMAKQLSDNPLFGGPTVNLGMGGDRLIVYMKEGTPIGYIEGVPIFVIALQEPKPT